MIRINLLREGRGAAKGAAAAPGGAAAAGGPANLNLILIGLLVGLGLLIGGGWWLLRKQELSRKQSTIATKEVEAQSLEKIIKEVEAFERRRNSLESRIALINRLKQNQKGPVRLLDHISRDLPDLVWLDKMTLEGNRITIDGRTLNANAAATFVENIKGDEMFEEPEFKQLAAQQGAGGITVYAFNMTFPFRYLAPPAETATAGESGDAAGAADDADAEPQS